MQNSAKVVVGLSGGVDSSVAAALLVDQGYEVIGIMLKLWSAPGSEDCNRCCTDESVTRAQHLAQTLNFPFYLVNSRELFFSSVVQKFIEAYAIGRTPNPCIWCNQFVRWGFMLEHAENMGAELLATGHYARLYKAQNGLVELHRALDLSKDQSYVLSMLDQRQLSKTMLPLGSMKKSEVRQLASRMGLDAADEPDSQDLCFVGGSNYQQFISAYSPNAVLSGDIVDHGGNILGRHNGLFAYTIGQRKGIKIPADAPYYVIEKDMKQNRLIVGRREEMGKQTLSVNEFHWIAGKPPELSDRYQFKIRYNSQLTTGKIDLNGDGVTEIVFDKPLIDITPGQLVVCYDGDHVLGGGFIDG